MLNRRLTILTVLSGVLLASAAVAAPMRDGGSARVRAAVHVPAVAEYVPQIDGPMATLTAPDGSLWAVWSYRASGEYDVAIASLGASGAWSEPTFFGRRDGVDEIAPALAVDASRNLYLVYATRQPAGLAYVTFTPATGAWSVPTRLSADRTAAFPAIRIVGDRVVVAWRTASGTVLTDLPTIPAGLTTRGIQDGPDSVDPLGVVPSSGSPGGGGGSGTGVNPGSGSGSGHNGNGHK